MPKSRLLHFSTCLATLFALTHCGGNTASPAPISAGGGNSSTGTSQGTATGGATSASSTTSVGGSAATGGTTAKASAAGGSSATGGTTAKASAAGGSSATGGTTAKASAAGGSSATGGTTAKASAAGGSSAAGGTAASGGTSSTGGTTTKASTSSVGGLAPTGGTTSVATTAAATGGTQADQSGVPLAKASDKVTTSTGYLNLGEIRLLNNRWGTDELNAKGGSCNTTMSVNVNSDKSVGYTFNRGNCGDDGSHPDFPELEFGINPFGATSSLRTSPAFSSTTLLPIQIKDITSASVNLNSFNLNIPNKSGARWDNCFEFWLSQNNPVTSSNPGVYAEVIAFYTWETDPKLMWACDQSGSVQAGDKSYNLCHQKDAWPTSPTDGTQWRFFHFNMQGGPSDSFTGKVDAKAFLDWLVQKYSVSTDLWLTRIEIGTEFDDSTSGSVTINSVAFEVNSQTRSVVIAQ